MHSFNAAGHPNILATHKTTLEFTSDTHLTKRGDCIVAVKADFNLNKIKKFLNKDSIKITISADHQKDTIIATPNPNFSDQKEIVIRKTDFLSKRTLATNASKSAKQLNKDLIKKLTDPQTKVSITIE